MYYFTGSIQQKLPKDLEVQLERFLKKVKQIRRAHKFEDSLIINTDEAPVYFDMPGLRTIERKGSELDLLEQRNVTYNNFSLYSSGRDAPSNDDIQRKKRA